ncbi:MAG: caspase family protein [Armatimonadetes bacterium]|nr:caspase family protein [Armatimonadota bacterium]
MIVSVAGHGVQDQPGDFYFIPSDGDFERLRSTSVNWFEFRKSVGELPGKVLVLVDACHAGAVDQKGRKAIDTNRLIREFQLAGGGVITLASSTGAEVSQENGQWEHGAFTQAVLEGLRDGKADLYKDGVIKISELLSYVKNRVPELTDYRQHPTSYQPESVPDFAVWKVE